MRNRKRIIDIIYRRYDYIHYLLFLLVIVLVTFQNRQVMVTSFGWCWYSENTPQSPDCWSSCNVRWNIDVEGWRVIVVLLWRMYVGMI